MPDVVLKTQNLSKKYGTLTAVNNLNLEIYRGEVFGFLGPNGAGKTTSITMMCGLLKPTAGRVLVEGRPINSGDASVRARVGVCPQEIVLWKRLTCLEQLVFIGRMYNISGAEARQRGEALLAELDLTEKRHKLAGTLSGGMQRRLNLAMALVHNPDIVVLDEPEAGLDPQSRVKVREYIQSLARKKTVIITTHNMDEAERVADRVAIIDQGRLLVVNTPQGLKQTMGQGDVVEFKLLEAPLENLNGQVKTALAGLVEQSLLDAPNHTLTVRTLNAVGKLAAILEAMEKIGLRAAEVRLRENTLEDVFIQLTGRRLRE